MSDESVVHYVAGTYDETTVCGVRIYKATEISAGAEDVDFIRVISERPMYRITCPACRKIAGVS